MPMEVVLTSTHASRDARARSAQSPTLMRGPNCKASASARARVRLNTRISSTPASRNPKMIARAAPPAPRIATGPLCVFHPGADRPKCVMNP